MRIVAFAGLLLACVVGVAGVVRTGLAQEPPGPAEQILRAADLRGGLCVHVGVTDGRLTAALGADERFVVHGLAGDESAVRTAREHILSEGIYGRVSIQRSRFSPLPYVDNLVNLVVVESGVTVPARELARVLAPNGVACLGGSPDPAALAAAGLEQVRTVGPWTLATRRRPAEMDHWTHARYGPAGTATSRDTLVGPPRTLRWLYGPHVTRRHGSGGSNVRAAVSSNGRLYQITDQAPAYMNVPSEYQLVARDAFNGLVLWERPVTIRPNIRNYGLNIPGHALAVAGDTLYTMLDNGDSLIALDGRTGEIIRVYHDASPDATIIMDDRLLLLERSRVRLLRADSGAALWTAEVGSYDNRMIAADGRAFVHVPRSEKLVCLDLADGRELWSLADPKFGRGAALAGCIRGTLVVAWRSLVLGLSPTDGSQQWEHSYNQPGRANVSWTGLFAEELVWVHDLGEQGVRPRGWVALDPASGKIVRAHPASFEDKCAPGRATDPYLIPGRLTFTHSGTGKTVNTGVARGACAFGALPANGMLYTFPTDCQCFPMLSGNMGFGPETGLPEASGGPAERLERGPAFGGLIGPKAADKDWPVYRGDPERRSAAASDPPAELSRRWVRDLGGRLSPPTMADGKVFVASVDRHQVHALDADDGELLWTFTAGGRVTAPPTYHRGAAVFGARDGWVYCLRASDGQLAWRFRAAPAERMMIAHGQPESSWPVEGSIPVIDERAYLVAGRHSKLGGGITMFALELPDGRVAWQAEVNTATMADMLVREEGFVSMQRARFNLLTGEPPGRRELPGTPRFFSGRINPFTDGTFAPRAQWHLEPPWEGGQTLRTPIAAFDDGRVGGLHAFEDAKYSTITPGEGGHKLWLRRADGQAGWEAELPIMPRAMVLTPRAVYVAGPDDDDWPPTAAELRGYSMADGKGRSRLALDAAPVFDGLIAAANRLYLADQDGKLTCFGE